MLAQDAAATAAAEVKVVTLPVTVRDKKGKNRPRPHQG